MAQQSDITLSLIVKDEFEAVSELVEQAKPYFDAIHLTVTHKSRYKDFQSLKQVKVFYFDWIKDFAKARNFALGKVKTKYWFWCDADDFVEFAKIPQLVKLMDEDEYDAMFLLYEYAYNERGEPIAVHWRERILRTSHPYEWKGALHETVISSSTPKHGKSEDLIIRHRREDIDQSERNFEILQKAYKEGDDPRDTMYLSRVYAEMGRYAEAIQLSLDHIRASGSTEDKYHSWLNIGKCQANLHQLHKAVEACNNATIEIPEHPMAYFEMARYEYERKRWDACIEWLKVGFSKDPPQTLHIIDPTQFTYRPRMLGAMAYLEKGDFRNSLKLIEKTLELSPEFKPALDVKEIIEEEVQKLDNIDSIKTLSVTMDKKFKQKLYKALPQDYKFDPRLFPLRKAVIPPKKWAEKSIAFMCGKTNETWGPDTLDKGMGGSEEAIVYLSRELVKQGYEVVVYNTRDNEIIDEGVKYLPWYMFENRDEFDTLVVWRLPTLAKTLKANRIFIDLHDVTEEKRLQEVEDIVDRYFVKSSYHRNLYPKIPDEKFAVIGNGILPEQFKKRKKKPNTVGYYSSPDRGLKCLLEVWSQILEKNPKARGHWYYGWETYTAVNGKDKLYEDITKLLEEHQDTFKFGGRISHQELADIMSETVVWGYPTEFTEIHCITALKAQQSGMVPITTNVAALDETVQSGHKINAKFIYHNKKAQKEFVDLVVEQLKNPDKILPVQGVSWVDVAKEWINAISHTSDSLK